MTQNSTGGGLTPDDIQTLQAPLPLEHHEAREKGTSKDGKKRQYLIYINQEGVIPLLNAIDPNWSWEVIDRHFEARYVAVTGRLTIKGVARDGVGGNSPNGKDSPVDEDTVKGAETDALKRAALRYGVGLYLRSTPMFWIDATLTPWDGAAAALEMFTAWYKREFGAQKAPVKPVSPPTPPAPPQNAPAGNVVPLAGSPEQPRPNSPSTAPTPNGAPERGASAELVRGYQDANGGGADMTPDADGFKRYLVHEIVVNEMPNGGRQYVAKSEIGDNIVVFGGDKFSDAGFDTSKWQATGKVNKVDPAAIVEAKLDQGKWLIRSVEVAG